MSQPASSGQMPRQIPYIIANEACERFSFYGMRNILTNFLISSVLLAYLPESERAAMSKEVFHTFVIGVYFFPLLGGWLADRVFGKYRTIFWFSILYCIGQFSLALFVENRIGFYGGLLLIALGSGGIKPLVASFMGDQFDQSNKHKAKLVFDAFYWIINFGSFFASLFMPIILRNYGPSVAFGVPGVLMVIATFFFWLGRHQYVHVAPAPRDPHSFLNVSLTALTWRAGEANPGTLIAGFGAALAIAALAFIQQLHFVSWFCLAIVFIITFGGIGTSLQIERARGRHPDDAVDGVSAVLRILIVFALTTPFWSLFDQKASTWVIQGNAMAMPDHLWWWPSTLVKDAAQMQALNPILVMLLIPFNNIVLYPLLNRIGLQVTALRRMGFGIAFSGVAWIFAGVLQLWLDGGDQVSLAWQIAPYALLTFGEVLVSATGLEFAYSQAPARMKGVIMAFWYLAVTIGNLWVLLANTTIKQPAVLEKVAAMGLSPNAFLMFFFAAFALVCAALFALYARVYPMQDHYRKAG